MTKRDQLDDSAIRAFLAAYGWANEGGALVKTFSSRDHDGRRATT